MGSRLPPSPQERKCVAGATSNRAGCTRQTIIVLEKERYVPSLSLAFSIARVFDKTIEEVFEYSGEE